MQASMGPRWVFVGGNVTPWARSWWLQAEIDFSECMQTRSLPCQLTIKRIKVQVKEERTGQPCLTPAVHGEYSVQPSRVRTIPLS